MAAIAATVAAIGTLLAVAPLHRPAWEVLVGSGDELRDILRSSDSRRADNLRERVPDRHFWDVPPQLLDASLDYLSEGDQADDVPPASPRSLESIVNGAFALRGRRVSIVAQVLEWDATEETDDDNGVTVELRLAGRHGRSVEARAGLSPGSHTNASEGDIVVVSGVVVATGVMKQPGERERRGVYVLVDRVEQRLTWEDETTVCPLPDETDVYPPIPTSFSPGSAPLRPTGGSTLPM